MFARCTVLRKQRLQKLTRRARRPKGAFIIPDLIDGGDLEGFRKGRIEYVPLPMLEIAGEAHTAPFQVRGPCY
jgi:hypothetical protein